MRRSAFAVDTDSRRQEAPSGCSKRMRYPRVHDRTLAQDEDGWAGMDGPWGCVLRSKATYQQPSRPLPQGMAMPSALFRRRCRRSATRVWTWSTATCRTPPTPACTRPSSATPPPRPPSATCRTGASPTTARSYSTPSTRVGAGRTSDYPRARFAVHLLYGCGIPLEVMSWRACRCPWLGGPLLGYRTSPGVGVTCG